MDTRLKPVAQPGYPSWLSGIQPAKRQFHCLAETDNTGDVLGP